MCALKPVLHLFAHTVFGALQPCSSSKLPPVASSTPSRKVHSWQKILWEGLAVLAGACRQRSMERRSFTDTWSLASFICRTLMVCWTSRKRACGCRCLDIHVWILSGVLMLVMFLSHVERPLFFFFFEAATSQIKVVFDCFKAGV